MNGSSEKATRSTANSICEICGASFRHKPSAKRRFCSIPCKGEWQRRQKAWDRDWLFRKYIVDGLSVRAIALIVHRNPKNVWKWLRGYGIETRRRSPQGDPDHAARLD